MSDQPCSDFNSPCHPLVEGAPRTCNDCGAALCLRQQVMNLTLGNTEEMQCLLCLGEDNDSTPETVMTSVIDYVAQRECFRKEWIKYVSVDYCPARDSCLPELCFAKPMT